MPIHTEPRDVPAARIKVLVIDDSSVVRSAVTHALQDDPEIEVVGSAATGVIGLRKIEELQPDAVTLDVEMPEMDGLETLRHIRSRYPRLIVIMLSTLVERGAAVTVEALLLGANDYTPKPANCGSIQESIAALRQELVPKIKQCFRRGGTKSVAVQVEAPVKRLDVAHIPASLCERKILAIGLSTGGPNALSVILPTFPPDFHYPILIVQHMPPLFTQLLAERLQKLVRLKVQEAHQGAVVRPGEVLIAPGGRHMRIKRKGDEVVVQLDDSPPQNSCRPSVDVLFESVEQVYRGSVVAAILTGMGQDGLRSTELLKRSGAYVIAQDEPSSVVWGMPGAVAKKGLTDVILPLQDIVPGILKEFERSALRTVRASK